MRFDLSDDELFTARIAAAEEPRSARVDDRKIVNAIFYALVHAIALG